MPWAREEPQTLLQKVQLLRVFRGQFDRGESFVYGLFSADESEVVGGSGLHPRAGDDISLEIGYCRRRLISAPGEEPRDAIQFALFRDGLVGSPVASAQLEAFDAAGTRVL